MNTETQRIQTSPELLDIEIMEARLEMETVVPTTQGETTPVCVCHF